MAGSHAHGPVTGAEQQQPAQTEQVVPTQGTRNFLHPDTRQSASQHEVYSTNSYNIKKKTSHYNSAASPLPGSRFEYCCSRLCNSGQAAVMSGTAHRTWGQQ